nr:unnamed protein product [Callosobruchus analis]
MEIPKWAELIGYADDIAAVIRARNPAEAKGRVELVVTLIHDWLKAHGLQLAISKTEIVVLTRQRRFPEPLWVSLNDTTVEAKCARTAALRMACAYRTVSEIAVLVVAGIPPIDKLAIERKMLYLRRKRGEVISSTQVRSITLEKWQERWEQERDVGKWTHILIPQMDGTWRDKLLPVPVPNRTRAI